MLLIYYLKVVCFQNLPFCLFMIFISYRVNVYLYLKQMQLDSLNFWSQDIHLRTWNFQLLSLQLSSAERHNVRKLAAFDVRTGSYTNFGWSRLCFPTRRVSLQTPLRLSKKKIISRILSMSVVTLAKRACDNISHYYRKDVLASTIRWNQNDRLSYLTLKVSQRLRRIYES